MIEIKAIYEELDANGETCSCCKKEIKGTKYVLIIQIGNPLTDPPIVTDLCLCVICKINGE